MLGAGCAWLATGMGLGWQKAVAVGATPFLGVEAIKVAVLFALAGSFSSFSAAAGQDYSLRRASRRPIHP